MGQLIPLDRLHFEVEVQETKLDSMSGLLCEVTPDNFCERTFEVRPLKVKLCNVIASANRKLFSRTLCESSLSPTPISQVHCGCAMLPFLLAVRYTPSLSTVQVLQA